MVIGEKEKGSLIDLLLETQSNSTDFTDKDILDEVNTFMFGVRIAKYFFAISVF